MESIQFPKKYSELSLEYLNKVLEPVFKSKIISYNKGEEIEPGFTGEVFKIIPEYEEKKEDLPKSLVIKFQTENEGIRNFMAKIKGYEKEIKIYEILNSISELNTPKIYYHDINKEGTNYILIMEDLNEKGLVRIDRDKPFDMKALKLIVKYFAELHSNFWGKEKLKNIEWINNYNFGEYMKEFTIQNFDKKKSYFISNNQNKLNDSLINIIKNIKISELYEKINPENNKERITLLHGDTQISNLLINSSKDKMAMIDWQYINIGLGLKDIVLFIGISFDEKNMKENDIQELKNLYYDNLIGKGIKYDKNIFEEDWKNICLISLCNIISASAEENIGNDEMKRKKYGEHVAISENRFITFLQLQNL